MLAEIQIERKRSVRDLGGKCSLIERVLSEVANIFRNASRAAGKMKRETGILNRHTYLHNFVPPAGNNDRVQYIGAESHTRDPLQMMKTKWQQGLKID